MSQIDPPTLAPLTPPMPPPPAPLDPDRGVIILVFGILSICLGLVGMSMCCCGAFGLGFGIPAWVMGKRDLRHVAAGTMNPANRGLTQAGMICGIIGTILGIVATVLLILYIAGIVSLGILGSMADYSPPPSPSFAT